MRTHPLFGLFLALLALATPAVASEPTTPVPAAHEEVGRTLDDLIGQLHDLGSRWREHFAPSPRGERPLITLMLRHKDELGLSADQVQSLERLRADFQREAIRRDADLRIAEMDLAALLEKDPVDLGQVEAKVREIERGKLGTLLTEPGPARRRQGAILQPRAQQIFSFFRSARLGGSRTSA